MAITDSAVPAPSPLGLTRRSPSSCIRSPRPSAYVLFRQSNVRTVCSHHPQYASYPTTDIRHILPLLVPAFASAVAAKPKELHGASLAEKQDRELAPKAPVGLPEGNEIKHDWMWRRLGEWFEDSGE